MKQYLLSVCYPAGGTAPPPDALQKIMRDVHAVQKEMQSAGVDACSLQSVSEQELQRTVEADLWQVRVALVPKLQGKRQPCCAIRAAKS